MTRGSQPEWFRGAREDGVVPIEPPQQSETRSRAQPLTTSAPVDSHPPLNRGTERLGDQG